MGDINPNNGTPRAHMSWQLQSGLDDMHPLREHIEALLSIIGTRAEAIRTLWVEHDIQLQCVGDYLPPGHGAHLDRECLRQAAQLGLAIDLDVYFVDAHEHG